MLDRLGRCVKLIVSSESISCHEFASQFGLEFVLCANKTPNLSLQSRPHVVYFNGSPTGHCLASFESGAPSHDGLIGRTDTANSDGRGLGVGVCVFASVNVCALACVHACVHDVFAIYDNDILPRLIMIIIKIIILYFIQIRHTDDFS